MMWASQLFDGAKLKGVAVVTAASMLAATSAARAAGTSLRIDALEGFAGASLVIPGGISDNGYVSGLVQGAGTTEYLHNVVWRGTHVYYEDPLDVTMDGAISGINNAGHSFVTTHDAAGNDAPFLWTPSGLQPLASTPNFASPTAINNGGAVVGTDYSPSDGISTGVIWKAGGYSTLSTSTGYSSSPTAINDAGTVTGSYGRFILNEDGSVNSESTAVTWGPDGVMHVLAHPAATGLGQATAISASGMILGSYYIPPENPALPGETDYLRWATMDAQPTVIAVPLGSGSVQGVNDAGQSFGNFSIDDGVTPSTPFVFDAHGYAPLEDLLVNGDGWHDMTLTAMNNSGLFVGYGEFNGQTRGFLVSPTFSGAIPEPTTALMATLAPALLARRRQR